MRILFDHCTPAPLRRHLTGHSVNTAAERGWHELRNGFLLEMADAEGYQLLITADQSLRYQQDLASRRIAGLVLRVASWPRTRPHVGVILEIVYQMMEGYVREFVIPEA